MGDSRVVSVLVSFARFRRRSPARARSAKRLATAMYGQRGTRLCPTAKRVWGFNPIRGSNPRTSAMTRGNAPPEVLSGGAFAGLLGPFGLSGGLICDAVGNRTRLSCGRRRTLADGDERSGRPHRAWHPLGKRVPLRVVGKVLATRANARVRKELPAQAVECSDVVSPASCLTEPQKLATAPLRSPASWELRWTGVTEPGAGEGKRRRA